MVVVAVTDQYFIITQIYYFIMNISSWHDIIVASVASKREWMVVVQIITINIFL